jgi:hypothetical protein
VDDRSAGVRGRFDTEVESVTVPAELAATLRAAGYAVRGPAGVGAGGPVWTAVGPDGDGARAAGRVVVHPVRVPAGGAGEPVTRRLEALRALAHPHLAQVVDVLPARPLDAAPPTGAASTDVAVLVAEVPGTTLAGLLAARGPLSAGEVVALTVPLAGALETLHTAGLVHGDVSPGNIVVRPDGRPVLIDLLGAVDPGRGGPRGTPGFAAPEVTSGPARVAASRPARDRAASTGSGPARRAAGVAEGAPADVFGLATVALTALDPAEVDGPLGQELAAARAPDPVLRPTAGKLAAGCFARAAPVPIALPDAGVLARTALAELAGRHRTVSMDRRSRHRAPSRRRSAVGTALRAPALGTTLRAPALGTALRAAAVAAVVAGVLGTTVAALGPAPADQAVTPAAAPVTSDVGGSEPAVRAAPRPDPVAAAVELTHRRAQVLAGGDVAAISTVVREGSAAHDADVALLGDLGAAGVRLEGLAATEVTARAVPAADVATGPEGPADRVDVSVTSGLTAHRRVTPDGVVDVTAQPPRTVVLTLAWTAGGWRVESVRDG